MIAILPTSTPAIAQQCQPAWANGSNIGDPGFLSTGEALVVFDDGTGPALYAGGFFGTAGGVTVNNIARWDGASWSPLGSGTNNGIRTLVVFDDGTGPALYAGGVFTTAGGVVAHGVAKWDGSSWSPLGEGLTGADADVDTLTVFNDGAGSALYVGGNFTTAGGAPVNNIAKWDGSTWSSVGGGVSSTSSPFSQVVGLTTFNDGTGSALYAGGYFTSAGGVTVNHIAKWDGSSWSALGNGMSGDTIGTSVWGMTAFDDGTGPALYAGGIFTTAGGVGAGNIAKWNGSSWSPLGHGVSGAFNVRVHALTTFDYGAGPALYIGGLFSTAGSVTANSIAQWNGSAWSPLGSGMTSHSGGMARPVFAMTVFNDGTGPALYSVGDFNTAGGTHARGVAKWSGCTGAVPADLNGDGVVNGSDLGALIVQWGTNGPADFNGNSAVDGADLETLLTNWGPV